MSSFIKKQYPFIILTIIPLVLVIIWFHTGKVEGGGEEGLDFYNPALTLKLTRTMWWDYDGGFPTLAWLPRIPSVLPALLLYQSWHMPNFMYQAATYFILLLSGGLSVYFLSLNLLEKYSYKKMAASIAGIFYILNPFSMSQVWGRGLYAQFFTFAFLPLGILLFLLSLKRPIFLLVFSLASVIFSGAFGITTFIIDFWAVITICFAFWVFEQRKQHIKLLQGVVVYFLSLGLWSLINSWWFLPTLMSGSKIYAGNLSSVSANLDTLYGVSRNYTPLVLIRLLQRTYFFDASAFSQTYHTFFFQLISWLLPLFLIIGVITIIKKRKHMEFKQILSIFSLGLVVSAGANPPLGWLFVWIFTHAPFLQGFRNPYEKFGIVFALGYSIVFAIGLVEFFESRFKNVTIKCTGMAAVLVLIGGIYIWPMWTGRVLSSVYRNLGVGVPSYYEDLKIWLDQNNKVGYRLSSVPLWAGDGTFYEWNSSKYFGIDPLIYILDTPPIASSPQIPYYYDFMMMIRSHLGRSEMADTLRLLRAKYLVGREDAYNTSEAEKKHESYLTEAIYPPLGIDKSTKEICQNLTAVSKGANFAWIQCPVDSGRGNWTDARYLHLIITTDMDANLDLAIRDVNQMRPRWYGVDKDHYYLLGNRQNEVLIPLGAPTEVNNNTDFSKIELVEVQAHPVNDPTGHVGRIVLKGIWLDSGYKQEVDDYVPVGKLGKLNLYELKGGSYPPEFGLLTLVNKITGFEDLFTEAGRNKNDLDHLGFVIVKQNIGKELDNVDNKGLKVEEQAKISNTRYWVNLDSKQQAFLILSQNYNQEWKILPGVSKEDLQGGIMGDIKLLQKSFLSEQRHFVVNGYANLWQTNGESKYYALVFRPQLYADIGMEISKDVFFFLLGTMIIYGIYKIKLWRAKSTSSH